MTQLNEQINNNINIIISDIERTSFLNLLSRDVELILEKPYRQTGMEFVTDNYTLSNIVRLISRMNPYLLGITFIAQNGMVYSNTRTTDGDIEQVKSFVAQAENEESHISITPVYSARLSGSARNIFSITRVLLHYSTFKEIGYISIDIDFDKIKSDFETSSKNNELNNLIITQNENIIYKTPVNDYWIPLDSEKRIIDDINRQWKLPGLNVVNISVAGQKYIFLGKVNDYTGWKIIQCLPYARVKNNIISSVKLFSFTLLIVLIGTILTGYFLSLKMSRPINKLLSAMEQIEKHGQLTTVKGHYSRKDEIGLLISSFNKMSLRLQESINQQYIVQENERKLEIKMMQAQINPHFLYNTLNMINSIAELNGIQEICTAVGNLSSLFRYNIKEKDIVTLGDEIHQVNNYIEIQKLRFPDKISFEYNVEEGLKDVPMLKFILQPIIENSIFHGIEKKKGKGHVRIAASESDGTLHIEVADDGIGMTREQIDELNGSLEASNRQYTVDDQYQSLGIRNVHYRIQNYYGNGFGLRVTGNMYGGVSVHITIPIVKGEEAAE